MMHTCPLGVPTRQFPFRGVMPPVRAGGLEELMEFPLELSWRNVMSRK
jgi:hypothetical protein